jgi:anti-anti-sigma regulatory factor
VALGQSLSQMATPRRRTITCDVAALSAHPDAATIDALARLALLMRRDGIEIVLRGASIELVELIAFVGLTDVLRVESRRQPEQRKQGLGVEEERELHDPAP